MTREEAIARIKDHKIVHKMNEPRAIYISEALDMAIKALEQEPCDDAISRQAVLAAMQKNHRSGGRDIDGDYIEGDYRECLYDDIISLPSVTSGSTSCDVAISKQAAIDAVNIGNLHPGIVRALQSILAELPPVMPQPEYEDNIAKAFQFGLAFGFGKRYDEMDRVIDEIKKVITPQQKMGCEGCIYEKTGDNSTYPCSHCGRCYTDKYRAESEDKDG